MTRDFGKILAVDIEEVHQMLHELRGRTEELGEKLLAVQSKIQEHEGGLPQDAEELAHYATISTALGIAAPAQSCFHQVGELLSIIAPSARAVRAREEAMEAFEQMLKNIAESVGIDEGDLAKMRSAKDN